MNSPWRSDDDEPEGDPVQGCLIGILTTAFVVVIILLIYRLTP